MKDIDRTTIAMLQHACAYFGPIYEILTLQAKSKSRGQIGSALRRLARYRPDMFAKSRNVDGLFGAAEQYELIDGILYRKVLNEVDHEIQLRIS